MLQWASRGAWKRSPEDDGDIVSKRLPSLSFKFVRRCAAPYHAFENFTHRNESYSLSNDALLSKHHEAARCAPTQYGCALTLSLQYTRLTNVAASGSYVTGRVTC